MMMVAFFCGMLVGFVCAKAYSIRILMMSLKNLFGPPYVRYAFPNTEYVP